MTERLTNPNPGLARLIRQTPEGMMFWAGTCTDQDTTCADCKHYGYTSVVRNDAGNAIDTHKHPTSCALYHKHTGRHGKSFDPKMPACKYFETRESETPHTPSGAGSEVRTIAPSKGVKWT
jgi:hypothetical protein